jgi:hypothetical protein
MSVVRTNSKIRLAISMAIIWMIWVKMVFLTFSMTKCDHLNSLCRLRMSDKMLLSRLNFWLNVAARRMQLTRHQMLLRTNSRR